MLLAYLEHGVLLVHPPLLRTPQWAPAMLIYFPRLWAQGLSALAAMMAPTCTTSMLTPVPDTACRGPGSLLGVGGVATAVSPHATPSHVTRTYIFFARPLLTSYLRLGEEQNHEIPPKIVSNPLEGGIGTLKRSPAKGGWRPFCPYGLHI